MNERGLYKYNSYMKNDLYLNDPIVVQTLFLAPYFLM